MYFLFFILGILQVLYFLHIVYFYVFTIKKWLFVDGIIINSKLYYDNDSEQWEEKIVYNFSVNDISFNSCKITKNLKFRFNYKSNLEKEYKIGQKVIVYYNPKNPKESLLDSKFRFENYLILLFVIFTFLVAIYNKY